METPHRSDSLSRNNEGRPEESRPDSCRVENGSDSTDPLPAVNLDVIHAEGLAELDRQDAVDHPPRRKPGRPVNLKWVNAQLAILREMKRASRREREILEEGGGE